MKVSKKILGIILLAIIVVGVIFLLRPTDIINYESKSVDLSEKILNNQQLDLYGQNTTTISEAELNNLVEENMSKTLSDNLPKSLELKDFYLDLQSEQMVLKTDLAAGILPIGLNIYFNFIIENGKLALQIDKLSLGKIKVPEFIARRNAIYNNLYYINDYDSNLDYLNILKVTLDEDEMKITYTFNIEKVINNFVAEDYQAALLDIITSLSEDEDSRSFATDLFVVFSKLNSNEELSNELVQKFKTDFNNLSLVNKSNLLLELVKYNLKAITNLLG